MPNFYRIGVDVGGTNTDAALLDLSKTSDPKTRGVVAFHKTSTTPQVKDGIETCVRAVLKDANLSEDDKVISLNLGTTAFINSVVQADRRRLRPVAVIRLAYPYTTECPAFIDFPETLKEIMLGHIGIIKGGFQIDGRPIAELDPEEVKEQAEIIKKLGLKDVCIIGIYSPLDVSGKNEYAARSILQKLLPESEGYNFTCSRDVAQVGFLERENASILNASIKPFAQKTVRGFKRAMDALGLEDCTLYLTQNDGTLTSAEAAADLPIRTFSSGATNSMRGASYLAGFDLKTAGEGKSMLVVDVGGTTSDVGVLLPSGFPRLAGRFTEVAGVRTNFSMPDVQSIGLGGGSRVRESSDGKVTVGPDSVGHYLTRDALVFGGDVLTTTDILVAEDSKKYFDIGSADKVSHIKPPTISQAQKVIKKLLENVIDRMKTSPEDATILLCGGGAFIVPPVLEGVGEIITPICSSVANAVGAAIANVSATVDTIEIMLGKDIDVVLESFKEKALEMVVANGASKESARIASIEVLPVAYVSNQATRLVVRAVGELAFSPTDLLTPPSSKPSSPIATALPDVIDEEEEAQEILKKGADGSGVENYSTYKPTIVEKEWILTETDLFFIMEGCAILGTGGGGSPYPSYLISRQIIREGGRIRVIDHTSLKDDDMIARGGFMGSPSVGSERIRSGKELRNSAEDLAKFMGIKSFAATLCDEIGGGNGLQSLIMGSSKYFDVPAFDGDLMGRAYPQLEMVLPNVYDRPNALVPCALSDGDNNTVILTRVGNPMFVETVMRNVATTYGSSGALCPPPLAMADARDFGCTRTMSQAWWIGRAVAMCRQKNNLKAIPGEILSIQNGSLLFVGKIVGVTREVKRGFTLGSVRIAALSDDELDEAEDPNAENKNFGPDDHLVVPFQNENICAYLEKPDGTRTVAAMVPCLINILDSQTGSALGTPEYMYGLRVTVIALAGSPLWQSPQGLKIGGPTAFGLDHPYVPVGEYKVPRSVIEEYST